MAQPDGSARRIVIPDTRAAGLKELAFWTPNGRHLGCTVRGDSIAFFHLEGRGKDAITIHGISIAQPSLSANGRVMAFADLRAGVTSIYLLALPDALVRFLAG